MVTSIGKSDGEHVIGFGNEAWNIADGYTKIKILKILIEIDLYEEIASLGKQDDNEFVDYRELPYRRVDGLRRLFFKMKQLIGNCLFAIDIKKDIEETKKYLTKLEKLESFIDGVYNEDINFVTKESNLTINEDLFFSLLNRIRKIKDELNSIINRAGLIFRQTEGIDLDKVMKDIAFGG